MAYDRILYEPFHRHLPLHAQDASFLRVYLKLARLFELLAAEIDRLDAAHVGDVVERIFGSTSRSAALPLASVPKSLSMPSISELFLENDWMICIGVRPACTQQLHLPVLVEALDEVTVGVAAGVGAEAEPHAGIRQLLHVDLVRARTTRIERGAVGILGLLVALLGRQLRGLLRRQAFEEERIVGKRRPSSP